MSNKQQLVSTSGKTKKITFHVISHTHWDREWYLPFESFRAELVDLIDSLLDILSNDKSFIFHLDGQSIILEDYLEIRPDKQEELKKYISSGNIFVGPWYVLSDEFLTSGEALIRNLMIGTRFTKKLGSTMLVGYLPDQFGHIAQLPQILKGFNITRALVGRGIQDSFAEHNWYALNGDQILAVSLTHWYNNAQKLTSFSDENKLNEYVESIYQNQSETSFSGHIILMNGSDHLFPQANVNKSIAMLKGNECWEIKQSSLTSALSEISSLCGTSDIPILFGELRSDKGRQILAGTLSSRIYLKLQNYLCQTQLEKVIEPLIVVFDVINKISPKSKIPSHVLDLTKHMWKLLIQNQAHDSICGCSIDEVHKENETRFLKVSQLTEKIKEYLLSLPQEVGGDNTYKKYLQVFNLTNFSRKEIVEAELEFPLGPKAKHPDSEPETTKEEFSNITLTLGGKEVSFELLENHKDYKLVRSKSEVPLLQAVQRVRILLEVEVKPFSVNNYEIVADQQSAVSNQQSAISIQSLQFENKFYKLLINKDGTLSVSLKEKNYSFDKIHAFSIEDDLGDTYHFISGNKQNIIYSNSLEWQANTIEENQFRKKFKLFTKVSDDLEIETEVTCCTNSKRIDFGTRINNNYKNKRIRLCFPTNLNVGYINADTPFGTLTRSRPPIDCEDCSSSQPLHNWIDHSDGNVGLAFFGGGLSEYELYKDGSGFSVTLIRAIGKLSSVKSLSSIVTTDAQCNREINFDYSIYPHSGNFEEADVCIEQLLYQSQPVVNQSDETVNLKNMITTGSEILVSALKKSDDNENIYIARFFNPLDKELENCEIKINLPVRNIYLLTLNEKIVEKINTRLIFKIKPFEIITLGIEI